MVKEHILGLKETGMKEDGRMANFMVKRALSCLDESGEKFEYQGGFRKGRYHGQGTFTGPGGVKYVGNWKNGGKNGQGIYTYANGDKYVGNWKDDNFHQGTYTFANGDKYVGKWEIGIFHGQGNFHKS